MNKIWIIIQKTTIFQNGKSYGLIAKMNTLFASKNVRLSF